MGDGPPSAVGMGGDGRGSSSLLSPDAPISWSKELNERSLSFLAGFRHTVPPSPSVATAWFDLHRSRCWLTTVGVVVALK